MRVGHFGVVLLGLVGLSGSANADMLASELLFHTNQTLAVCTLYNLGPDAVTITQSRMLRDNGKNTSLSENTCTGTLAANTSCEMLANIPNYGGHLCKIVTAESATNLRGHFELRQGNYGYLLHTNLH